jgi:lantibiotic modifying enzyme
MGIGLSRALSLRHVPDDALVRVEIEAALAETRKQPLGLSHCLCHGDPGNSELFLQAAVAPGEPALRAEALGRGSAVVDSIAADGLCCGTPLNVETPSLMVGLAGIG